VFNSLVNTTLQNLNELLEFVENYSTDNYFTLYIREMCVSIPVLGTGHPVLTNGYPDPVLNSVWVCECDENI